MNLETRMRHARDLTPTEQQMATTVLALGDRLQALSIKEFARASSASIASVHRFCKKLGLEGFKELKVEMARLAAQRMRDMPDVDINFPFGPDESPEQIVPQMRSLYVSTLRDTCNVLDTKELDRAARIVGAARRVGIYTQSHNLYPAQMFRDRLLSIGHDAFCDESIERQLRCILASKPEDAAIFVSYSGLASGLAQRISMLTDRKAPIIYVGTPAAKQRHPGLAAYLLVADREHLQERITQFASHISVQFVLDALFSCVFANDYDRSATFLKGSLPYIHLPGIAGAQ